MNRGAARSATALPSFRRRRRFVTRARLLVAAAVATALLLPVGLATGAGAAAAHPDRSAAAVGPQNPVDAQRAVATYQALQRYLYVPQHELYRSSDPSEPFGYLWDFVNAFAATDYVAAIPGAAGLYQSDLQARNRGIMAYYNAQQTGPTGQPQPPAFASGVRPPLGPDQPTYYDDNAWVALDFLQEYDLTHQQPDLARAEGIFRFAVNGWDTSTTAPCPGGVFWEDVAGSPRNTISNAPNAEAGLRIYQATHDPYYLSWATRMYDWVRGCLKTANGMYNDHLNPDGSVSTDLWSYNQGTMVGAGTLLYQVTGNRSYLAQAEQTAAASVSYYGSGGNLYHQPDVFNSIFFRNLFELAKINHDPSYARMAASYADTAWLQNRQSNGLFTDPDPTGGESPVNQTAPMAEIYALLAQSPPVFAATGATRPSAVIVQPGAPGSSTLVLQSVTGNPQTVQWTASAPPGLTVSPESGTLDLPAGGSVSTPISVTGATADGKYQVTFKFTSPSGPVLPVSMSVIVARPGDLAPFFNDAGISDDSNQAAANFDGLGYSYSEQALTAAGLAPGAAITSGGIHYTWPGVAAGQPDNLIAAGQIITVPPVLGATELGVIGSATHGPSSGPMTITYTDGTTQSATMGFTDWTSGSPSFGNATAAATPYRNSAGGTSQRIGTSVFSTSIALQPGKTVASVALPARANQGELHVFALGTDKGPLTTAAAPDIPGSYHTVKSTRLLDTRAGLGAPKMAVAKGATLTFDPTTGITGPVAAVVLNVTEVNPAAIGYLTVYPAGGVRPLASNLNFQPRQTVPNMVVVKTGAGGAVSIFNGSEGTIDILADIEGYVAGGGAPTEAGTMVATEPTRVLDTRNGTGGPKMKIPAYTQATVPIAGLKGIPADASAVALNLTAVTPAARGYLTAYPGTPTPDASTLNFEVPQTRANLTLVQVNQGGPATGAPKGTVSIFNGSAKPIDVVADVDGYFTAGTPAADGSFVPSTPFRVFDSRTPGGRPAGALTTSKIALFPPNDPTFSIFKAVQVNVIATRPTAAGFLTTWEGSVPQPSVSSSNFVPGANVAGSVIVPVNADGTISIYNGSYGTVDLVVDVNGFFLNDLTNLPAAARQVSPRAAVAKALSAMKKLGTRSTPKSIIKATR